MVIKRIAIQAMKHLAGIHYLLLSEYHDESNDKLARYAAKAKADKINSIAFDLQDLFELSRTNIPPYWKSGWNLQ